MANTYRVDHLIKKSKKLIVEASNLCGAGHVSSSEVIDALATLTGAVEALALATNNMDLRYNQVAGTVSK